MTTPAESAVAPPPPDPSADSQAPEGRVPLREALAFWLKLGFVSFGGPAGQIALMHEQLVERRRWISEKRFMHALNYCMLLPGPEAQQLATYLGWLMHRSVGGIAAGMLFVLPSFLLIALIAWGYLLYGHLPVVAGLFDGIKPAVLALVLAAGWRIGKRALHNARLWAIAAGAFIALHLFGLAFPLVIVVAAALGTLASPSRGEPSSSSGGSVSGQAASSDPAAGELKPRALIDDDTPPPAHARPGTARLVAQLAAGIALWLGGWALCSALASGSATLTDMAGFFTQAALLTFGGAYAVLPYVHQAAVEHYQWVTASQMLDALALGETTPGPLIMIVAFVGFIGSWTQQVFGPGQLAAAGWAGAAVATFFTFLPSFLFILVGGPLVESTRSLPRLGAALEAITAAVVGVIASLALALAQALVFKPGSAPPDWLSAVGAALALWLLVRVKTPIITTLVIFGLVGVVLRLTGLR